MAFYVNTTVDNCGFTPMHVAAWKRDSEAILVLSATHSVNATSRTGLTPLHLAVLAGSKLEDVGLEEDELAYLSLFD